MKRTILLLLLMFLVAGIDAAPVDSVTARRVAENFWQQRMPKHLHQMPLSDMTRQASFRNLYLFGCDSGYVLVSASTLVRPILAYGFGDHFDPQNQPPQLHDWVEGYTSVIEQIEIDQPRQENGVAREWKELISDSHSKARKGVVEPMISVKWNQGGPYNLLCPSDEQERRTVAGCVAVAMAQIMKYWNYPIHGKGSHSYRHNTFGQQSADFENTYYDWANMPNQSFQTDEQRLAVATLIYHCGVSVNMNYGIGESGAYTCYGPDGVPRAVTAFTSNFDYQPSIYCRDRDAYDDDTWINLLAAELEAQRPILYTGSDPAAGHAFNLDGLDEDRLFHINWGWGGGWNGYYAMGAFSPGAGGAGGNATYTFNLSNSAIMGIIPNGVLKCTVDRLSIGKEGGVATTFVSSNVLKEANWTAVTDADWLTLEPSMGAGLGDTTLMLLRASANPSGVTRSATVTIEQDGDHAVLTLFQNSCATVDSFPYLESFEDSLLCWTFTGKDKLNVADLGVRSVTDAHDGSHVFRFGSQHPSDSYDQYLISPRLSLPSEATMTLYYRRDFSYEEQFEILYSTSDEATLDGFTNVLRQYTVKQTGWRKTTVKLPQDARFVAVHYYSPHQRTLSVDDIEINATMPEPAGIGEIDNTANRLMLHGLTLNVEASTGSTVTVSDIVGRIVYSSRIVGGGQQIALPRAGVYLVSIDGSKAEKIVAR